MSHYLLGNKYLVMKANKFKTIKTGGSERSPVGKLKRGGHPLFPINHFLHDAS